MKRFLINSKKKVIFSFVITLFCLFLVGIAVRQLVRDPVEEKRLEAILEKEMPLLAKNPPFLKGYGKLSSTIYDVTVTYWDSTIDEKKTEEYQSENDNSVWKLSFLFSFGGIEKPLTIDTREALMKIGDFSTKTIEFEEGSSQYVFSGIDGDRKKVEIWMEKPDDLDSKQMEFVFFVLDKKDVIGEIILAPFK